MSVPKHWLLGGWYPRVGGLIVHQQRYRPSNSNKNVDIKFIAHDDNLNIVVQIKSSFIYHFNKLN